MNIKKNISKKIFSTLFFGVIQGFGICIGAAILILISSSLLGINLLSYLPSSKLTSIFESSNIQTSNYIDLSSYQPAKKIENPLLKYVSSKYQIDIPITFSQYRIQTSAELYNTVQLINKSDGNAAITLADGIYSIPKTIFIRKPNIMFLSESGDANKVVLKGNGMRASNRVNNLFEVYASGFVIDGITMKEVGNHLIQIKAENNAHFPIIRNSILEDSYEQMIKVSYDRDNNPDNYSDSGLIENCIFQYTAGVGPNYYIGGIDAHGIRNWVIRNNVFKYIASPQKHIAEHAIHLWNNTENNLVENNIIIDSDRAIGFGMLMSANKNIKFSNYAGIIRGNMIYHSDNNHPYADTGIVLENSPRSIIEDNYIFMEHSYPRAIEYRFTKTNEVVIKNNYTNKSISSRDGGKANITDNVESLSKVDFLIKMNELATNIPLAR